MRLARKETDLLLVSIFVNPTQFGPNEDLAQYPRDLGHDSRLCEQEGVDAIFFPDGAEMYAAGASVIVREDSISKGLCGRSRPGHFQGVLTIVAKLFNLVQPHVAVFGQKDAQQLRLIEKMVEDLNFPVRIMSGPIVREPDGLAMSSRNIYLSDDHRSQAVVLSSALFSAEELIQNGENDVANLKRHIQTMIESKPDARIDYIELVDWNTFSPIQKIDGKTLIAVAAYFGETRLIDNMLI